MVQLVPEAVGAAQNLHDCCAPRASNPSPRLRAGTRRPLDNFDGMYLKGGVVPEYRPEALGEHRTHRRRVRVHVETTPDSLVGPGIDARPLESKLHTKKDCRADHFQGMLITSSPEQGGVATSLAVANRKDHFDGMAIAEDGIPRPRRGILPKEDSSQVVSALRGESLPAGSQASKKLRHHRSSQVADAISGKSILPEHRLLRKLLPKEDSSQIANCLQGCDHQADEKTGQSPTPKMLLREPDARRWCLPAAGVHGMAQPPLEGASSSSRSRTLQAAGSATVSSNDSALQPQEALAAQTDPDGLRLHMADLKLLRPLRTT